MEKIKITKVKHVQVLATGMPVTGTLHITSHHLIFVPSQNTPQTLEANAAKVKELWITYPIIAHCSFRPTTPSSGLVSSIRLRCRDFTFYTFNFESAQQARDVFDSIKNLTCKLGGIEKLYAFTYAGTPAEKTVDGWKLYNAKEEWKRQGISEKGVDVGWRISRINLDYAFSPTYPALLVVPTSISDNTLNYAGQYRSKVRIPVLTYLHPINNCSITRSAQPKAGLRNHRSVQDEKLVSACFFATNSSEDYDSQSTPKSKTSPSTSQASLDSSKNQRELADTEKLEDEMIATVPGQDGEDPIIYGSQKHNLIVDARPTVNALAMQAVGLGSENMDNYRFAAKVYLGIENIHVMRDSLSKVIEAIKDSDLTNLPPNKDMLAKSGWLKHITGLLDGSALIARQVGVHHSHVLIHCSDGWDRTSQLSALSQLMLDPYYRTLDGFIVLVEKDWLSFGHMFQHRNGYLNSEKWFVTHNDGLAGSTIQPGSNGDGRGDAIENALANAKRFFSKKTVMSDEVDSDGEPIPVEDLVRSKNSKDSLASQEATKPKETSPVFHQFLDCTYQLLRQHPTRFEFNERFLRRLLYHLYSCQYGTFLYNNEKSRLNTHVHERTRSIWDYFLANREGFLNEQYDGGEVDDHVRGRERLVFPDLDKTRWWHEVFGRKDQEMNSNSNLQTDRYLGSSSQKGPSHGVLTGVETARSASGTGATRNVRNVSNPGGLTGLKESFSNLGIGATKDVFGDRSPRKAKEVMEVEMQ